MKFTLSSANFEVIEEFWNKTQVSFIIKRKFFGTMACQKIHWWKSLYQKNGPIFVGVASLHLKKYKISFESPRFYTANPFPVMKTGFSLCTFSHREIPVMKAGSLQWEQGSPVMKTGFSLWKKSSQGKSCSGLVLAQYGIVVYKRISLPSASKSKF